MPIDIEHDDIQIALQKLKARENSLRQIEAISGLGSWEVDLKTQKSIWSDQSFKIYGIDKKTTEPTLALFLSHVLPEDLPYVQKKINEGITSGKVTTIICRILKEGGEIATLSVNGQVILDEDGNPTKLLGTTQDISEQIQLKKKAQELSALLESSSNEIYIVDFNTLAYRYVNRGATEAIGYTQEEFLQMNVRDINPLLCEKDIHKLQKLLANTSFILNRTTHRRKDGSEYAVQSYIHKIDYEDEKCFVIFDTDISSTVTLELRYKQQAKVLEFIHDAVISTDREGIITNWNRGSTRLFGSSSTEMIGKSILKIYKQDNVYTLEELFKIVTLKEKLDTEAYMLQKNGETIICNISLSISRDEGEVIDGYIGYLQDITIQKRNLELLENQSKLLEHQAHYDVLTNLPNRALFKDRLTQTIAGAKRNHEKFALLFIDLDQFKTINDSLGHHIGDEVLIEASRRLSSTIREEDTLARLGGDEFTIILKDVQNIQGASVVAQKIVDVMKEVILISPHNLYVTASIGISIYPDDAASESNLIKYADVAMYKAKEEGRNNYQFYSSDMSSLVFERVVLESSLRIAIDKEEFIVYFQPQFSIKNENIIGMEALVRWQHSSLDLIPPGRFITIAEESGLIIQIDRIVMKKAMHQFVLWYKKGLNPGKLSLNLAMKQLAQDDLMSYLLNTMNELNFKAEWLELEVTESQVMKNPEDAIEKLNKISKMGIDIAIDDFGTGYSSLSYLKKLPLDKLKIDQSFVCDIPEDEDDMAITKAIIALGQSLNLKVIAEGVETQAQKEFLAQNNCDLIQGFLYSRPVTAKEIEEMLQTT